MRPDAMQSIRGIQTALTEIILPELTTLYSRDALQTCQMLLESLAAEWDTGADDLRRTNTALEALLSRTSTVARSLEMPDDLLRELTAVLARLGEGGDSIVLSKLVARNEELSGIVERVLATLEDEAASAPRPEIETLRRDFYGHLRNQAMRGWSFWDVASFRGKIAEARSRPAGD